MNDSPITVYSKPSCVQCTSTYRALDRHGIQYDVIDVTEDENALNYVKSLGYSTAPVVTTPDQHWGGFRPDKIAALTADDTEALPERHDSIRADDGFHVDAPFRDPYEMTHSLESRASSSDPLHYMQPTP